MGFLFKKSETISNTEPRINALKFEQSTYGAAKAVVYGTNRLCGNVIDNIDFTAHAHTTTTRVGKGGGGQTTSNTTYSYTARTLIGLCEGQIQGIKKVLIDDASYSLGSLKLNLFPGTSSQVAWGEMQTYHPERALFYKNFAYVAGNIDLTSSAAIPQFNFEINGKFTANNDDISPLIEEGFSFSADSGYLGVVNATLDYSQYFIGTQKIEVVYIDANSQEHTISQFTNYSENTKNGSKVYTFNFSGLNAISAHVTVTYTSLVRLDANPKDIVFDILTNKQYGVGLHTSLLDVNSFNNFSTYCIANNIFLSPVYDAQSEAQQVLTELAELSNSAFIWSQGMLKIVPLGDEVVTGNGKTFEPNLEPIYDLTEDDFLFEENSDPIVCSRTSQADVKNSVKVEYLNRANNYHTEIAEAQDLADIELYGLKQADTVAAHQICTQEVADKVASLALARNIAVRNTYTFRLPMRYILLEQLDVVTITSARLGLNRELVRIISKKESDGELEFEVEELVVGTATAAKIQTQRASFIQINTAEGVGDVNPPIIFEPPFEMTQDNFAVWIGVSHSADFFGGAEIWISDNNETYKMLGEVKESIRQGVLAETLLASNTQYDNTNIISVDMSMSNAELLGGTQADMENMNTLCYVDGELISFKNAVLIDDFTYHLDTLFRGAYYTTSEVHEIGSQFCRIDANLFLQTSFTEADIGKTIYLKILSRNSFGSGLQSLADVPAYQYKIKGNAKNIFPDDVQNFNVVQHSANYVFSWQPTSEEDVYEIRQGASWEEGTVIGKNIAISTFRTEIESPGTKTFWIKSHNGKNYSDNAAKDMLYVDSVPDTNVVVAYDLMADLESGIYENLKRYGNTLKLKTYEKWRKNNQKWGSGSESEKYYQVNGIWGAKATNSLFNLIDAGVITENTSDLINAGNIEEAGNDFVTFYASDLNITIAGRYTSPIQDLGGIIENDVRAAFAFHSSSPTASVTFEFRYSSDGETWTDWKIVDTVTATFRYYQCRLNFYSSDGSQVICTAASIVVDVPDKIETMEVQVTNSEGVTVDYNFYAPPSIVGTVTDDISAYVIVASKTNTQAVIKLRTNDGGYTIGTANLIMKGY